MVRERVIWRGEDLLDREEPLSGILFLRFEMISDEFRGLELVRQ